LAHARRQERAELLGGLTMTIDVSEHLDGRADARPEDWLGGGGEMGKLVRSLDWSRTPLGAIESWPQSLRTTVSLCLGSNFPISLAWGPKHVQIYNDGYWPICGGKHPHSMGQDFSECWASAWPAIGEAFNRALAGETSYLENQRMFLDRNGYLEETFFTFSFSPIRDETGGVGGLFHPVTETTAKMVGERRTRALRELASRAGKAQSSEEAFAVAAQTFSEFDLDIPFAMFYLLNPEGTLAQLGARTGLLPEAVAIASLDMSVRQGSTWPLPEVVRSNQAQEVADLAGRFGSFLCGPYPEPPTKALALPIMPPGCERPLAILVAGVSSRLPLNESYRAFYDLLATTVTAAVANARAYEEERKRAEALAELDRAKTAFFSNVSHEFRTPLTLLLGPLEETMNQADSSLSPHAREQIALAHRNGLRLLKLVNTLLDFSRLEAGRVQVVYEATEVSEYTSELASVFRSAVERAGMHLIVDCPPAHEPIYLDREMWEKIVLNLISNAFKFSFEGEIRVRLRRCDGHVELEVSDTGTGIPEEELPNVFKRFHRVRGARGRTHEGSGIGLALVQELVHLHGGEVQVTSTLGEGTSFVISIPEGNAHLPPDRIGAERTATSNLSGASSYVEEALRWLPEAVPDDEEKATCGIAASGAQIFLGADHATTDSPFATHHPSLILLADDNADMRDYVKRLLSQHYEVLAVADGAAALRGVYERLPDLVLTDVMMPEMDGFELLRELRNDMRTREVPVIMLSARAGEESAVEGLEAGADDYLVKPFSARELLARVRTHLEMAKLRRRWTLELEAANQELEAFSYSVSHDLRAPLRAVSGFANLLSRKHSPQMTAEAQRLLSHITAGARQMEQLIEDLLRFARLARQPLLKQPVSISAVIHEVLEGLHKSQGERNIKVSVSDLPDCVGDRALLKQVFENLLSNAFKFTSRKEEALIEIGCQQQESENLYFVRDNGEGFDMRYADKLFGVFQRFHRAEDFEGTGVGLSIVHRIVQRHGGLIRAEAEVGKGAAFYFTLPESMVRHH
jgi:signal transduction histidine kinase